VIHPSSYDSLGELLRDALIQYKTDTALIEANRKRENHRMSYRSFRDQALPVARGLEDHTVGDSDRVALLMSNQSKWLLGAYAALYRGCVLVPLDYKLTAAEQAALLDHAKPKALIVEYPLWRQLPELTVPLVIVTEAPKDVQLGHATRWEDLQSEARPQYIGRDRNDIATIVYSSGTGGDPKGCLLSHGAYLAQLESLLEQFPMERGDHYFSILPTNHAIDFMCGFVGPLCCGATVVHQRSLRPEFIFDAMKRYQISHMAVVPLILTAFERAIREKIDALDPWKAALLDRLMDLNQTLTDAKPNPTISRFLLKPIHDAFGGKLKLLFCGGAFVDQGRAEFFYRLGIPVVIGYGLTEACTVVTVNDLKPFRADSVGKAVKGTEIRILNPDDKGIGQVEVRGPTLMSGYLDAPEQTEACLSDGWLRTGDLGYFDASYHLHLVGRSKNMIVTAGGKNIYPEDIEHAFSETPCEEFAVFAANYIWPDHSLVDEELVVVIRGDEAPEALDSSLSQHNRKLPDFKRIGGFIQWGEDFPRTASMKLKRQELAAQLRQHQSRETIIRLSGQS
jgi:long-chain acyl-CoA synthetase